MAQISPILGEVEANLDLHLQSLEKAGREGASLVVFPELSLTGYDVRDLVPRVSLEPERSEVFQALAEATRRGPAAAVGFVEETPAHLFHNAAAYFEAGRLVHIHRKVYLPTYGMFEEERYFAPAATFRAFDTALGRVGMLVCEDFWHLPPAWILALDGARLLLVLAASPVKTTRLENGDGSEGHATQSIWVDLARNASRMYTLYTAFANRAGTEDQVHFGGGSFLADPTGAVTARAQPLAEDLLVAEMDDLEVRRARIRWPMLRDERPEVVLREIERLVRTGEPDEETEP
jgi:predicted amidohydrolase